MAFGERINFSKFLNAKEFFDYSYPEITDTQTSNTLYV